MKKTLLAAALLAGFATAGVAQAETSVTLYGILDTGYGYQNFKLNHDYGALGNVDFRARSSGMRDGFVNGNRWGLKGSEDLGNGLRAIFQLENGFSIANGNTGNTGNAGSSGGMFTRQAFVGLSSDDWGSLTMGRQYGAAIDTMAITEGNGLGDFDHVFGSAGLGNRINNSFKYTTPSFSGFKAVVLYGTSSSNGLGDSTWVTRGNDVDLSDRGSRISVGLNYTNGPLALGAAYDRQSLKNFGGTYIVPPTGTPDAMTAWEINGGYDFEVVKLGLMFGQDRNGKMGWGGDANGLTGGAFKTALGFNPSDLGNGYQDFKSNNWAVSLSAPVGPGTVYAFYNGSHSNLGDGEKWGDAAGNINAYQLQYQYPLSKRTKLYVYGGYEQNVGYVKDLNGTEAGVGLNHKF